MLQSTYFDPVLGLDIHVVGIPVPPAPVPVPTPIPMPFVGMVFDPIGLAVGAAIGMAMGGGPGIVLVNSMPVTNCGTDVTNKLTMPHIPAPGVMFIPPPMPSNDALLFFGSLNVSLGGSFGVRLGDVALSCSDPVRLPTSIVLAIPKGPLVLNMPAMVPDLKAAAMALAMRGLTKGLGALAKKGAALFRRFRANSPFFSRLSQTLGGCVAPAGASRWRQMWARGVRMVTGHPVDVVTGNLFTSAVDVQLAGPLPLVIERVYESAGSRECGALGYGWSHTLDESLWMERGRAVVRCGDGREIEFPLWDLPDRIMRPGDIVTRAIHQMSLKCTSHQHFELTHRDGVVHEFAPVPGGINPVAYLVRIRSRDGNHAVELTYDQRGRLEWVKDCAGRDIHFKHDAQDRLTEILLPSPTGEGWYPHRRYAYDKNGDLAEVLDTVGNGWRYLYQSHLLVQETDRTGFSFYFQYDGSAADARCVRTWGDGGVYDHVINYDPRNRKTVVEDSLGAITLYAYNERNQVTSVTNAFGQTRRFEYDPATGGRTVEEDPLGSRILRDFDASGNAVKVTAPHGAVSHMEFEGYSLVRGLDARENEWRWRYDRGGHLVESIGPTGEGNTFEYAEGLLIARRDSPDRPFAFGYDDQKNLANVTLPNGGSESYLSDRLGRVVQIRNAGGGMTRLRYDLEGRVVETHSPTGVTQHLSYDGEGHLLEVQDGTRHRKLGYTGRRIVWQEESGARVEFAWDTEGRLIGVVNEAGERFDFVLDALGRMREAIGFDGRKQRYEYDAAGRVTKQTWPSGRQSNSTYDATGRLLEVKQSDGTFARFKYDLGGLLCVAENESGRVEIVYDASGRVTSERVNEHEVRSTYGLGEERVEVTSSLGSRVAAIRDAMGDVAKVFFGPATGISTDADAQFERDALGIERLRRHKNGMEVAWDADIDGRPLARRTFGVLQPDDFGWGLPPPENSAPGLREVDARTYRWRGEEQIEAIVEAVGGSRGFDHDARGRLVRERRPDRIIEKAMDHVGNVYRTSDRRDRRYGRGGRLEVADGVEYRYDEDGRQTKRVAPDGSTWSYFWNGHGALRKVECPDGSKVELEYDAFQRRTAKRTFAPDGALMHGTEFIWDGHVVIHELDSEAGLITWHYAPDTFVPVMKEIEGQRWVVVSDHIGVPTEMYDDVGRLVWKMQLDVFGKPEFLVGSARDCPWRWPGQYEDVGLELSYNRTRYYSWDRGSYLSPDPAGLMAGLHLYSYVPDPLTWIDLLGLTGTYIFQWPSGEMYIGKGPVERARASQGVRAKEVGQPTSAISQGAHADFGDSRMGLMVEAELMRRNNFGTNPNLLNAINSPGKKLLAAATPAEKALVAQEANALEQALQNSTGKIC